MAGKKAVKAKKSRPSKTGKKGGKKRSSKGFQTYIFKLVKQIHKGKVGISSKGMAILSSFANEMFDRVAREAGSLVQAGKSRTLGSREAATAVKLAIPGELGRNAAVEAAKALAKYAENQ
eukprot:TRINITY_DN147_c0_g1_i2.p4 TRINITY_DN147_c0_g1~~TRINITY_DN147_c0_g1_i2.p4  ORF type:complete len:120 (-),score=45.12 TRINITY_DN147_c0_g1_i2:486-845(-)